eukprot:Skav225955  [mRNA]  locus=scaffold1500:698409:699942:- [translate_table: standard]
MREPKAGLHGYVCAPNFWEDLRGTLQGIEQRRDDNRAGKLKAQQASVAMLKELDAESRLERIVPSYMSGMKVLNLSVLRSASFAASAAVRAGQRSSEWVERMSLLHWHPCVSQLNHGSQVENEAYAGSLKEDWSHRWASDLART